MAPRWVVRLLERVVPEERHDDVIGDLEELHGRRVEAWGRPAASCVTAAEGVAIVAAHVARAVVRGSPGLGGVSSIEVRLALRLLARHPATTLTSVVALGVGIGIAAGGLSVVRQVLHGELPFADGDRWVLVETYRDPEGVPAPLDLERLRLFRASASTFRYIGGAVSDQANVAFEGERVERVVVARVTPGTFGYLPYVPLAGRLLGTQDGIAGSPPVALIRESLWERMFARADDVVERSLDIDGVAHAIVGVLPDDAGYPSDGEIWMVLEEASMGASADGRSLAEGRRVGVLAPGVTPAQAEEQLEALSARAAPTGSGVEARRHKVTPMARALAGPDVQVAFYAIVAVLVAVLALIAANVANLILARTSRRLSELTVRAALGASRARLVGQLLVEALAIGAVAAVPGLAIAGGVLSLYDRFLDELPFWIHLRLDPMTAAAVVCLTLFASALIGVAPALRATRRDTAGRLKHGGRGVSLGVGRLGGAMITAQVALSVTLLGCAAVLAKGYRDYVRPAFDLPDDRVLTARLAVTLPDASSRDGAAVRADSMRALDRALREALGRLPGVTAVGVASHLPRLSAFPEALEVEGVDELVRAPLVRQGPGAFEVLGVEPLHGRLLEERDLEAGALPVAVVNQAFAVERFGTSQAVGRRVRLAPGADGGESPVWHEIVGVVPNVMEVTGTAAAGVYLPLEPMRFFSVALLVDSSPMSLAGVVRRALFDLDARLDVREVVRLDDVGSENRTALWAMSAAMGAIGAITLLLAIAGIYSIVSLAVSLRTREIGVRVALGAERSTILRQVLGRAALLLGAGGAVGVVLGLQVTRARIFVFALPGADLGLFLALAAVLCVAGFAACWIPARRALSIQPVVALRA